MSNDLSPEKALGGFEPLPELYAACGHPEHSPPMHLWIPPGQQYRHVCPRCHCEFVLRPTQVTL